MLPPLLIMDVGNAGTEFRMRNGYDGSRKGTVTNTITRVAIFNMVTNLSRSSAKSTDPSMLHPSTTAVQEKAGGALIVVD